VQKEGGRMGEGKPIKRRRNQPSFLKGVFQGK
jgi:hypothetical protein